MSWDKKSTFDLALNEPVLPQASASIGTGSGYDAATDSPSRSSLVFPVNSFNEHSQSTRTALVQKVRALDANLSIFSRITGKIGQHAIGKGVFVRPATRDIEWNDLNRRLFEEWASNPPVYSIDASRDHYEDQRLVAETVVADGEFFEALVNSPAGAPMVQAFDVFEIKSPYGGSYDAQGFSDGIRTNEFCRPTGYAVQELSKPGINRNNAFRVVGAQDMLHLFRRRRAKQLRGLTWFYSGINQGIDALDLRALITGTAKLHSGLAVSVKGGKPRKKGAFGAIKGEGSNETDDYQALERIYGGGIIQYLGETGEIELHSSQHPGQNLIEFLKFLYCDIAAAVRLPLSVVYTLAPLGGASVRGELEDAQWLFDAIQDMIIWRHSFPIYRWRTARFIKEGRLRPCKDPIWWATTWRGPAKLTVDLGRTADANIKLMKNGGLSHVRYFEERGLDADAEIMEEILFHKRVNEACAKHGVDPNRILEPSPGTVTQINMPDKDES